MKHSPQKFKTDELRRKQIETTLNQLHKLQSEIYELNIPVNPHSSPPVKKQIKQLTYLYENMTKPKEKNQLNIEKEDIEFAFKILEGKNDRTSSIDSRKLSSVMKSMFDTELQTALIKKGDSKPGPISAEEIYQFLNFNQFDDFDPKLETFKLMTNEQGKFSLKKYQQYSSLIGLPAINNEHLFLTALGLKNTEEVTYEKFKQILHKHA